jgi:hypothetical protein
MDSIKLIRLAKFFLRLGLAFVFVYAAVEIHFNPDNFLRYVPAFVTTQMDITQFLPLFGGAEILLSVWLLSGKWGRASSMISFLLLCAITIPNYAFFTTLFRNVAIASGALSLFCLEVLASKMPKPIITISTTTPTGDVLHKVVPASQVYPPTTIGKI